jgi:hypothetical protein
MASLIYSAIASLDGYVEDPEGRFDRLDLELREMRSFASGVVFLRYRPASTR